MKNDDAQKYDPANIPVKDIYFTRMNEQYREKLCHYAERFVGQEHSNDMVQDAFENLWNKRESNLIIEKLSSFLFRSVKNHCLDKLKHEKVKREHSEQIQIMYDIGERSMIQDDNNPQHKLESQEREEAMKKAIEKLPEQQRAIILLWLEGETYQKIAEKLDITEGSVCKQINRAKTELRKKLKG